MTSAEPSGSSETLVIKQESDNEAIRLGTRGTSTASLQLAVELLRSGGELPSDVDETVSIYLGRLRYLQRVKHLIVESQPESIITTFLAQAVHYLSTPSSTAVNTTKITIFPNVETLTISSGVFHPQVLLINQPLFVILSNSLPRLHTFIVKYDNYRMEGGRSPSHDVVEYLKTCKKRSWKKMRVVETSGVFSSDHLPTLAGGKTVIKYLPSMKVWPPQAGRSTMSGVDLGPMTSRIARSMGIRNVVKETLHLSTGGKCVLLGQKAGESPEISEGGEVVIHGEVVLRDFDSGLDGTGCQPAEGDWIEAKVRKQVKEEYVKYGEAVEAEAQKRISFHRCAAKS